MSRTREISGYINRKVLTDTGTVIRNFRPSYDPLSNEEIELCPEYWIKCKLIIELPSPKITVSEEEFDEISKECLSTNLYWNNVVAAIKSRLFKDAE